ncbi:unnamed protein product [Urochloa humidicola]
MVAFSAPVQRRPLRHGVLHRRDPSSKLPRWHGGSGRSRLGRRRRGRGGPPASRLVFLPPQRAFRSLALGRHLLQPRLSRVVRMLLACLQDCFPLRCCDAAGNVSGVACSQDCRFGVLVM